MKKRTDTWVSVLFFAVLQAGLLPPDKGSVAHGAQEFSVPGHLDTPDEHLAGDSLELHTVVGGPAALGHHLFPVALRGLMETSGPLFFPDFYRIITKAVSFIWFCNYFFTTRYGTFSSKLEKKLPKIPKTLDGWAKSVYYHCCNHL